MDKVKIRRFDNNSIESSIVFVSNSMSKYYILNSIDKINMSDEIVKQMKKHLIRFYKNKREIDSVMIYLLWQEFRDLYEKWMDN